MKFAILASALAATASAAGFDIAWTVTGDKCDGQISLGEFKPSAAACTPKDCGPIAGMTNVSTLSTCAETYTGAADEIFGKNKKPYVLVEVFKADSNCAGAFDLVVGVTADGVCYPGTDGKASYKVTWSAETGTVWLQYTNGMCTGEGVEVKFPNSAADGKTCTGGQLKALAVAPSANSSDAEEYIDVSETDEYEDLPSGAENSSTSSPEAATPAPATTTSAGSLATIASAGLAATLAISATALA